MDDALLVYRKPFVEMSSSTTEDVSACEGRSSSRLGPGGEVVRKAVNRFLVFLSKKVSSPSRDRVADTVTTERDKALDQQDRP